jgi:predicted Zn-dependent protease with MMP-like domain
MISIEEMEKILDEIALEFPKEFFVDLNGGIVLLPEAKLHEKSMENDLYILAEYNRGGNMGRFIAIYYGSFERACWNLTKEQLKEKLKKTLKHEFRHHFETMAGEKGLEKEDARQISEYISKKVRRVDQ